MKDFMVSGAQLNKKVFFPPLIFLLFTIIYSLNNNDQFLAKAQMANRWILQNFGWLFTWSTFLFLLILLGVYFSPFAKLRIGGEEAQPILSKWRWFAIALCTTLATGLLFWGVAEPLYHFNQPPDGLGVKERSEGAAAFSMSTMFMHWSFTPYGIYTITGLVFALVYYNLKQPFSIASLLYPLFGKKVYGTLGTLLDILCLYGLVAGMAASLGTGIFALMGGLDQVLGIPSSDFWLGIVGLAIVATFIVSAASGLNKGIRILSDWNIKAFFVLVLFVAITGPTSYMLEMAWTGVRDYGQHFLSRSTNIQSGIDTEWQYSWTIFYWANWFAWAPVAALFLGRLSVGYTVRDYLHFNLIFPSLFAMLWMSIFSGIALEQDVQSQGDLFDLLTREGEQYVLYRLFESLPLSQGISILTILTLFISYVTAADSNVSAMSAMSSQGINPSNPEAPLWIKVAWGSVIGLIAWIMITTAGVDGIRLLCVLGGFPSLFIILLAGLGLIRIVWKMRKGRQFDLDS
ncbi:MAG: BCCT family transporter [Bacteroidota bacterium]